MNIASAYSKGGQSQAMNIFAKGTRCSRDKSICPIQNLIYQPWPNIFKETTSSIQSAFAKKAVAVVQNSVLLI
jgi:hypothetical protein